MRFLILFLLPFFLCHLPSIGQTIMNPVFDRTDAYRFRVEKVFLGQDTTFILCSFKDAGRSSWVNISKETYLEDAYSGKRYPLLKAIGLPYSPERLQYMDSINVKVMLLFPHMEIRKFNLIESEENEAFNIYGIDLNLKSATALIR